MKRLALLLAAIIVFEVTKVSWWRDGQLGWRIDGRITAQGEPFTDRSEHVQAWSKAKLKVGERVLVQERPPAFGQIWNWKIDRSPR